MTEHVFHHVHGSVPGRFGTYQAAAEFQTLPGEDSHEGIGQTLVLAEHVPDFPGADPDVAGRHVHVRANITG